MKEDSSRILYEEKKGQEDVIYVDQQSLLTSPKVVLVAEPPQSTTAAERGPPGKPPDKNLNHQYQPAKSLRGNKIRKSFNNLMEPQPMKRP